MIILEDKERAVDVVYLEFGKDFDCTAILGKGSDCTAIQMNLNMVEKPHEVQQREVWSHFEKYLQALIHAGDSTTGKKFCRLGPRGPGPQMVDHEPAMLAHGKESQQYPGLYE